MSISFKKILLAGTALVAASAFAPQAQAAVVAQTLGGNVTWAIDGDQNQVPADGTGAAASDTVDLVTHTLTVTNDGTANDGGGIDLFTLGAVTGTTGSLLISSDVPNVGSNDLVVNGTTITISGAGSITVLNEDDDDAAVTAAFTGAVSTGGNLVVTNAETSTADDVALTIGGALTVTGTTGINGGTFAGAASAVTITGNSTFTGAVTLTPGAGAGSGASLTLNGATNAFTGGLTLDEGAGGTDGTLTLSGAVAQTVSGAITGQAANEGAIVVQNASGVTFSGVVGAAALESITVENSAALNSSATFQNTVTAAAITLGAAGTGTNLLTFDVTTNDFTVTGTVDGAIAAETNNVVVSGGSGTLTQATAWGGVVGEIDNLSVTGTGTILDSNAAITLKAATGTANIATGATLDVGAGLLTSPVLTLGGTLLLSGTGGVAGVINGSAAGVGTLSVTENATVTGNIGTTLGLAAINVATTKTLTATADVKATTTTLTGTGTLALGALAHNVTTNIVAAATGAGAVTIADGATTTTMVGNIGTSAAKVATLDIAGAAANLFTTTGNLYVNAITANDADTIQFLGTSAAPQTVSGTITGGIVTVGNGVLTSDVTFDGVLASIASGGVTAAATGTFNANATFDGVYTNAGTTQVNAGKTLTVGSLDEATAGVFNMQVQRTGGVQTTGIISETGDVDLSNDTVNFVVTGDQPLTTGVSVLNNVFVGTAQNTIAGATVTDNSFLYTFALVNDTNNVDVTVTAADFVDVGTTSGNIAVGDVLVTDLAASVDPELNDIQGALAAAGTEAEVNTILESVQPTVDGGAQMAALDVGFATQGIADIRMAAVRSGDGTTGMAAGASANGVTMWLQGYGQTANQDMRDGIDGFDASTLGGAIGIDSETLMSNAVVGVAFNYGRANIESDNANTTDTDIDNYGISLYSNYDLGQQMFLNAQVGYAYNDIESTRHDVGGLGLTANGDTNSNLYSAKLALGRDYEEQHGMMITPVISAAYNHLETDGYTETGTAGGALLTVGSDSINSLKLGVGATASWKMKNADGSVMKPSVHAGYAYEAIDDAVSVTSSFTGDAAGNAFASTGADPAQHEFNVGAGMVYMTAADWDLSASYDYRVKEDFSAHSGILRAASHF